MLIMSLKSSNNQNAMKKSFFPDVSHIEISILFVFGVFHGMSMSDP